MQRTEYDEGVILKTHLTIVVAIIVGLGCFVHPTRSDAQTRTSIASDYPSLYRGVRPLGMGNAFLAVKGTDENAPFYNPAAIRDYSGFHMNLASPSADVSTNAITLGKDVIDTVKKVNDTATTTGKVDEFNTFIKKHSGDFTTLNLRMPALSAWTKYFYASILVDSRSTFAFRTPSNNKFEVRSRNDGGGYFGTAYPFFNDQLQVGVGVKVLYRWLVDEILTATDATQTKLSDAINTKKRGMGVGFDLGLKEKIPTFDNKILEYLKPTAALVWQDIGDTRFAGNAGRTPQSVSAGFAIHPDLLQWELGALESTLDIDFRELNQQQGFTKKLNVGYEVRTPRLFLIKLGLRAGLNQGYPAVGATLDAKFLKTEIAYYQQETGEFDRRKGDGRLAFNLIMGF